MGKILHKWHLAVEAVEAVEVAALKGLEVVLQYRNIKMPNCRNT